MKSLGVVAVFVSYLLLIGCGGPEVVHVHKDAVGESTEEREQWLVGEYLIESGDWVRATTNDGEIHEFSVVSITEETIQGGDTMVALTHLQQIELFPLLYTDGRKPVPHFLIDEEIFENKLKEFTESHTIVLILDNGDLVSLLDHTIEFATPSSRNVMIIGNGNVLAKDDHYHHHEDVEIPISSVVHAKTVQCHWNHPLRQTCVYDAYWRWSDSEDDILALINNWRLLKKGDWVRAKLRGDQIQEFQYQGLNGTTLVGGDSSVAIAEIASMEIYPTNTIAPTKEEAAAGAAAGIVAVVGIILMFGTGIPVPVMP